MQCGDFQLASSSAGTVLQLSGSQVTTRPIKGTRPRGHTRPRRAAWLRVAIEREGTRRVGDDHRLIAQRPRQVLRIRIGDIVPDLAKLERFAQVQHLVQDVTGRLRLGVTHLRALASSFPEGSITGAPRFVRWRSSTNWSRWFAGRTPAASTTLFQPREPVEHSHRTAVCREGKAWFHVGAGIVADSDPEAEYEETLNKAAGWLAALNLPASALALYPASGSPNLRA